MSKKKHKKQSASTVSPKSYIKTRARNLPLDKCYINDTWQDEGMATVLVSRRHTNGNRTFALFLVDIYCLGVKDTLYEFNDSERYENLLENLKNQYDLEEIDYVLAHNIIYGAVAYAEELGFKPAKDFDITQFILEEDDDKIDLIHLEFGMNGLPAIFVGKEKHPAGIIATLEKSVGKGNFIIITVRGVEDDYDEEDYDLDFEEDYDLDFEDDLEDFDEDDEDYKDYEEDDEDEVQKSEDEEDDSDSGDIAPAESDIKN